MIDFRPVARTILGHSHRNGAVAQRVIAHESCARLPN